MRRLSTKPSIVILAAGLSALAACGPFGLGPRASPEPSGTATPDATRTPSPTATQTPTPTATAPAAAVSGDPRALSLSDPVRQDGAPCGFVDTLDFPLNPPDGAAASGGGDFARFRDRYDGYHAGEDWRVGGSSFGEPVYSIAHGLVTYAQPLGWGADKGVVIVEHTFRDRRRVLSFYGHLDPPSVVIRAGQCVVRGDQIGAVGDPRTRPHLHFEIRVHLPDTPGPGYWPSDPRRAGWRPPSATIWNERITVLPGVAWTRLSAAGFERPIGLMGDQVLVVSDGDLLSLDRTDGARSWSYPMAETVGNALLDTQGELVYVARAGGVIEAFRASELAEALSEIPVEPLWRLELRSAASQDLAPLPGGGLVASSRSGTVAISTSGSVLWNGGPNSGIVDWAHSGEALVLVAVDGVWVADAGGSTQWSDSVRGEHVVASGQPYVYAEDGVYRLDKERQSVELLLGLPSGFPRLGALADLPEGGAMVVHRDLDDTRLIAIGADGSMRWERSIELLQPRAVELLVLGEQAYLVVRYDLYGSTGVDIYQVSLRDGELLRVFSAGTRSNAAEPAAFLVTEDTLLISIAGVGLSAWSPELALRTMLER